MRLPICFVTIALFSASTFAANESYLDTSLSPLENAVPNQSAFKDGSPLVPKQIKTAEDIVKYFGKEQAKVIGKKVDLKRQMILVFAWRGSGGDQLDYDLAKSKPPIYRFRFVHGETDDLRKHAYVYVAGLKAKWTVPG